MVNLLSNFGLALMIVATIGFIALICGIIIEKSSLSNKFMNLFNDAKEKRF